MPLVVAAHVPIVFGSGLAVGGAAMVVAAATTVPCTVRSQNRDLDDADR
jgi:hypothetical protein